jgi:Glycosyl transferase family 2
LTCLACASAHPGSKHTLAAVRIKGRPTLSVIVPATDDPQTLPRSLAAIRGARMPPEEIIVVDRPKFVGPAEARNLGARSATKDVLVFVDADVEVAADAFERIRHRLQDGEVVAIFGSYDDTPSDQGVVSRFRNLLHHYVHHSEAGPASTFWAGLGAIRRDTFHAVGGFDERRFPAPSVEDIELGMRLADRGHRIVLDPAIQGTHLKRWTLAGMAWTDVFDRGVPWVRLLLERRNHSTALNLSWRNRGSTAASLLLAAGLVRRQPRVGGVSLIAIVLLNRPFYVFLLHRGGARLVAAGLPLHVLHQLLGAAAVPLGTAAYLRERLTRCSRRRRS